MSLVPEMQKGNNNARTAHIALNVTNTLLFLSQVPTGLEIVGKVGRVFRFKASAAAVHLRDWCSCFHSELRNSICPAGGSSYLVRRGSMSTETTTEYSI